MSRLSDHTVVVVQSALFDGYRRRLVVPLVRSSALRPDMSGTRLNLSFTLDDAMVVLHPLDMVSVALDHLGEHVGSLSERDQATTDALDEVFTRAWN